MKSFLVIFYLMLALEEANDISFFLKALRPRAEAISNVSEYVELAQLFPGLMRFILNIWKCSKHYTTPSRLAVIIQEICNDIIEGARNHIAPAELFTSEPEEAAERLRVVLRVVDSFKSCYYDTRALTLKSVRPWNLDTNVVFKRLHKFVARVTELLGLFETITELNRLEKIEVGGTKGKILSSQIAQIYVEFTAALKNFAVIKYDILNLESKEFIQDLGKFRDVMTDLDRRISTILNQAFDDCPGLYSCFRLLESFGGMLNRPEIFKEFEKKYFELLKIYSKDLDDVLTIFLKHKTDIPIHYNMAPVTGAVAWIHELKDRIGKALDKLHTVFQLFNSSLIIPFWNQKSLSLSKKSMMKFMRLSMLLKRLHLTNGAQTSLMKLRSIFISRYWPERLDICELTLIPKLLPSFVKSNILAHYLFSRLLLQLKFTPNLKHSESTFTLWTRSQTPIML